MPKPDGSGHIWYADESRSISLLAKVDFATFRPEIERTISRPMMEGVAVILKVVHAVMARKYADLTLSELADCLTLPVLLELWPMLLKDFCPRYRGRSELQELK
jgi:hypothetical protein